MELLIPIIAIVMVFGAPTFLLARLMDLKKAKYELESEAAKEVKALQQERKLLMERIDAIESIVHDGDFELNQKLKQLALKEETKNNSLPAPDATALPEHDGS